MKKGKYWITVTTSEPVPFFHTLFLHPTLVEHKRIKYCSGTHKTKGERVSRLKESMLQLMSDSMLSIEHVIDWIFNAEHQVGHQL